MMGYLTSLMNASYMKHATSLTVHYKFQNLFRTTSDEDAHKKDINLNTRRGDLTKEPNIHS
jgi:hypothetical protein